MSLLSSSPPIVFGILSLVLVVTQMTLPVHATGVAPPHALGAELVHGMPSAAVSRMDKCLVNHKKCQHTGYSFKDRCTYCEWCKKDCDWGTWASLYPNDNARWYECEETGSATCGRLSRMFSPVYASAPLVHAMRVTPPHSMGAELVHGMPSAAVSRIDKCVVNHKKCHHNGYSYKYQCIYCGWCKKDCDWGTWAALYPNDNARWHECEKTESTACGR